MADTMKKVYDDLIIINLYLFPRLIFFGKFKSARQIMMPYGIILKCSSLLND
jgi:hypothetical protein